MSDLDRIRRSRIAARRIAEDLRDQAAQVNADAERLERESVRLEAFAVRLREIAAILETNPRRRSP